MAYATNSINTADPGPALYSALSPLLTTAGFTSVDTVTISGRTHNVWKSAAASNLANLDWYLDVGYPTTSSGSNFTLQTFEYYDPATDLGYRGAYSGASDTTIDATTSSRYGATGYALETNWIGGTGFGGYGFPLQTNTTASYHFSVTTTRVIMLLQFDSQWTQYAGLYEPDSGYVTKAGAALYPLVCLKYRGATDGAISQVTNTGQGQVNGALTRVPPATALSGSGWGSHLAASPSVGGNPYNVIPSAPSPMMPFTASRVKLLCNGALQAVYGYPYDLATMPSSASFGDTVSISGATWVLAANANGYSGLMKAV